eukprot:674996-Pyramimonas_sp.AAC.1
MASEDPTHYCQDTKSMSQIDRLWRSEPNWMSRQLQHSVSVVSTPEEMRAKEPSDHAAIRVHIRHRDLEGCYCKPAPAHILQTTWVSAAAKRVSWQRWAVSLGHVATEQLL